MSDGFFTAARAVTDAIFFLAAIYVYLALVRQILARPANEAPATEPTFGLPDVVFALMLGTLLVLNFTTSVSHTEKLVLKNSDLIINGLIEGAIFTLIVGFLQLRGRSVNSLGGFSRLGFLRTLLTGSVLIVAGYPFILLADLVTQKTFGELPDKQGIVELFTNSQSLGQRTLIIFLATAVAPVVEEFVFRFFLYGVMRRYLGPLAALLINATLFAAIHAHLPSALPLFVLGVCFTLAYEWSGSILVSMTMHSLFNGFTLIALAFPNSFSQ